jgi:predicted DNA-binding transcriptional regulator AlpA
MAHQAHAKLTEAEKVRQMRHATDDPLLTPMEAAAEAGRAMSTFWRDVKLGTMPQPVYILPRAPRWRRSWIRAVIDARCRAIAAAEDAARAACFSENQAA